MTTQKYKYKSAVGLEYSNDNNAPLVSVKGETFQADEIVKIAQRYGVPVVEDSVISSGLAEVEMDEEIPEELFQAVAVLLDNIERSIQKKR